MKIKTWFSIVTKINKQATLEIKGVRPIWFIKRCVKNNQIWTLNGACESESPLISRTHKRCERLAGDRLTFWITLVECFNDKVRLR